MGKRIPAATLTGVSSQVRDLFQLAEDTNMTIGELHTRAGVHPKLFVWWRRGRTPKLSDIEACYNVLGYTLQPVKITKDTKHD